MVRWRRAVPKVRKNTLVGAGAEGRPGPGAGIRTDYTRGEGTPPTITVEESIVSYMEAKKGEGLDKETLLKHRKTTARLLDYCNRKNILSIKDVGYDDLTAHRAEWDKYFKSPLSKRTNQERLKNFCRHCLHAGWIDKNPAEKLGSIKIRKDEETSTQPFTPEEMGRIFAALPFAGLTEVGVRRVSALILIQRHAGLAIQDGIVQPRTGIVEERDGGCYRVITKRTKTGSPINNVIPPWVGREVLSAPNSNSTYLLWSGEGDPDSMVKYFQKQLKKVFKAAGVLDGHSHRFRDTAACELLLAGVLIEQVAKFLGDTVATTEKYYGAWNKRRQEKLDSDLRAAFGERPVAAQKDSIQ
jgi:integrase/recombinase XerD